MTAYEKNEKMMSEWAAQEAKKRTFRAQWRKKNR